MSNGKKLKTGLKVLYEDNHCLAVFKPAGLLTVADKTGDISLLDMGRQYIKKKYGKPGNVFLGVVHRLDRPVSGVVLFARTSKAAARLSNQFRSGSIRKIYRACVRRTPVHPTGTFTDFLVKDRKNNIVSCADHDQAPKARQASLDYRVIRATRAGAVLEIQPHTGRSHQIRVQLASHGMPIIGDVKYGGDRAGLGWIALHAAELQFEHPVRHDRVAVKAPPPAEWDSLFRSH